jgi:hypothetical protein
VVRLYSLGVRQERLASFRLSAVTGGNAQQEHFEQRAENHLPSGNRVDACGIVLSSEVLNREADQIPAGVRPPTDRPVKIGCGRCGRHKLCAKQHERPIKAIDLVPTMHSTRANPDNLAGRRTILNEIDRNPTSPGIDGCENMKIGPLDLRHRTAGWHLPQVGERDDFEADAMSICSIAQPSRTIRLSSFDHTLTPSYLEQVIANTYR